MALSPNQSVKAPVIEPEPYNLLSSVTPITGDGHWINGLVFAPEGNHFANRVEVLDTATTKSTSATGASDQTYNAWVVELSVSRPLGWAADEVEAVAMRAFEQTRSALIEQKLAYTASETCLADSNCTAANSNAGTAALADVALARILQKLASKGGQGTVYMNPGVASMLTGVNALVEEDGKLYTVRGDLVICGNVGATGPSAASAAADQSYLFAHLGLPQVYLGDIGEPIHGIEHTTNTRKVLVEQAVAVAWNPGQWSSLAKFA